MVDTPLAVKKNCSYLYTSLLSFLIYKGIGIHVWNVNKNTSFFFKKGKIGPVWFQSSYKKGAVKKQVKAVLEPFLIKLQPFQEHLFYRTTHHPDDYFYHSWFKDITQRKKCPYLELFRSTFSRIRTEYEEILRISPYSVRMQGNVDQNNSEYGHFLRSVNFSNVLLMIKFVLTSVQGKKLSLHGEWNFPLRISLVTANKSAVLFGHFFL